jgi:hypothetical protein
MNTAGSCQPVKYTGAGSDLSGSLFPCLANFVKGKILKNEFTMK